MSALPIQWVFTHSRTSGSARLLMLAIADVAGPNGVADVSVAQLLEMTHLSYASYARAARSAEAKRELRRDVNGGSGPPSRAVNRYEMVAFMERPA